MRHSIHILMISLLPTLSYANTTFDQCVSDKYQKYIQASISWYENIISHTVEKHPDLNEVTQLFFDLREKHFLFNQKVFDFYLINQPDQLNLSRSVESWLDISQYDIQQLSLQSSPLSMSAKEIHALRQTSGHRDNYKLRTALADLFSDPNNMKTALDNYNQKITQINQTKCGSAAS